MLRVNKYTPINILFGELSKTDVNHVLWLG